MREETDFRPKPMVDIGGRPVVWHLMKIFSHYGVTDFVILAGYKADVVKDYFSNLDLRTRDFRVTQGSVPTLEFISGEQENWRVTVLDTGLETLTGERLLRAQEVIGEDDFLCTYGDGLAPVNIHNLIERHRSLGLTATLTVTQPSNRFGLVRFDEQGIVAGFNEKPKMVDWVNMGFFVFGPGVFSFLREGESLEEGGLVRLAQSNELGVNKYDGFWEPMDTYREYKLLNDLWVSDNAPWKLW